MFYEISGLVEVKSGEATQASQTKLSVVVDHESESEIRSIFSEHKILILSISPFKGSISDFYETSIIVNSHQSNIWFFSPLKIKEAFEMFYQDLNFEIVKIDSKSVPISEEQNKAVIEKLSLAYPRVVEKKQFQEEKKDEWEKKLEQIRNTINLNIAEARQLIAKVWTSVWPMQIKKLQDAIDDLQKYRMWTNVDKMSILFQDMLGEMENIELLYYKTLEEWEKKNVESDFVNDLEIVQEYEKFKKSQKLKKTKAVLDKEMKYYQQAWKSWIILKLLLIEWNRKLSVLNEIFYWIFDFGELLILFLISNIILLNIIRAWSVQNIAPILIDLSLLAISLLIFKNFRRKNIIVCILLFLWTFLLYLFLKYLVQSTFAL